MVGIELSARIGEKGQVVIPKPLRDQFGLSPESEIVFSVEDEKIVLQKKDNRKIYEEFVGAFKKRKLKKLPDIDGMYEERFRYKS